MSAKEILEGTLRILGKDGRHWTRGTNQHHDDRTGQTSYCLFGAIAVADGRNNDDIALKHHTSVDTLTADQTLDGCSTDAVRAAQALTVTLEAIDPFDKEDYDENTVQNWQDLLSDYDKVKNLIEKAIEYVDRKGW